MEEREAMAGGRKKGRERENTKKIREKKERKAGREGKRKAGRKDTKGIQNEK